MNMQYDIIVLFSGGLDSILAAKLLEEQGLRVKCLHFYAPFFGHPRRVAHWRDVYGLDIDAVDVGPAFVEMLIQRPVYGFGKVLNPCVDCKILLARHARELMAAYGASCIASGEVLGQRPMSQRRDTLNVIKRDAQLGDSLLRPLSALHLDPTQAELSGLVDRTRLLGISGRGRKDQLELAEKYGLKEIPTPAGGCRLTERENARRYWKVLNHLPHPAAQDFALANTGRQYWRTAEGRHYWLCIGRHQEDNLALQGCLSPEDLSFKLVDFPGPLGVGRQWAAWPEAAVREAASFVASFSPRAVRAGGEAAVSVRCGEREYVVRVLPARDPGWNDDSWESVREEIRAEQKTRLHGAAVSPADTAPSAADTAAGADG